MKNSTKTALVTVGIIVIVLLGAFSCYTGAYNKMVRMNEDVNAQWAQVENQYQRRLDLIPNLVATVKGYAAHESDVLTEVTEARARAGGVLEISDEVLNNPESFRRFQEAQSQLSSSLQRLLAVSENYPELKANQNFLALQDQIEGTENRIATERNRFNSAVKEYNAYILSFPRSIIAGARFTKKEYFAADAAASAAPKVEF
ncbi:MAG: LemA family protein [Treponemataceae bacterium]|nr:MAG: LemA family protein [Treponemataceae bacterium]